MLKTALTNKSIEKGRALEAAEELQVVAALVKQRRDSIEQFEAAGRTELAEKERAEIAVLEQYLPPAASDDEIAAAVDAAVTATGADLGQGHGQGDESGDGRRWPARPSTAGGSTSWCAPGSPRSVVGRRKLFAVSTVYKFERPSQPLTILLGLPPQGRSPIFLPSGSGRRPDPVRACVLRFGRLCQIRSRPRA